jgi:hypothetical protein
MAPPVFAWFQDRFTTTVHVLIRRHRCCGNSDCGAAGAGKRDTFALGENGIAQRQAGGSHGSVTMHYGNGTEIPIVEEGYSPEDLYIQSRSANPNRSLGQSKSRAGGSTIPSLKKRDCTFTPDGESHTRPGSTRTIEGKSRCNRS